MNVPDQPSENSGSPGSDSGVPSEPAPLLEIQGDSCPNCGAPLAEDAVVCMRCGYDQKAGAVRKPEVGVEYVETPKQAPEFVAPARLSAKALAIVGVVIMVCALVARGWTMRNFGWGVQTAAVFQTLYNTLLHACTGVIAVGIAARILGERFTRIELTAARMLVAFSIFQLGCAFALPGGPMVANTAFLLLGIGAYLLALMVLFKKDHTKAGMIAIAHVGLFALIQVATWLSGWLDIAIAHARNAPPPG